MHRELTLKSDQPAPLNQNMPCQKRADKRHDGKGIAICISAVDPADPPFEGRLIDFSRGGVALLTRRTLPLEAVLQIRPASNRVASVGVKVISCRQYGRHWRVGCQFLTPPPASVMVLFC